MKNVALATGVLAALALQGCSISQQVVSDLTPYSQMTEDVQLVDSGLMEKYDYLIARDDNVEIMEIEGNILPESRGYFKFIDGMNDVHYDEVIIDGDIVTRFRGGSPEIMDIQNLLDIVVGDHFIQDNNPR